MFKRRLLIGAALVGMVAAALGLPYLTPANASVDGIQVLVNDCSSLVFQVSITRETEGFEDSCGGYCIGDYCLSQDFGDGYCQDIPEVWQTTITYAFEFPETVPDGTTIFLGADHCWGWEGVEGPFTALQVQPDCDM
ncbi:MAG: hypothetical protein JW910_17605, partial [Anaerolineae bacterium]|nr:hypothetical protein [Anaerolineae bacterium]